MNEKGIIQKITPKLLSCDAEKYMEHLCGKIDEECRKIGDDLAGKIAPALLYSVYDKECICKEGVILDGERILIHWDEYAGNQIEFYQIEKVAAYFLTIGECKDYISEEIGNEQNKEYYNGESWKEENRKCHREGYKGIHNGERKRADYTKNQNGNNSKKESMLENFYIDGWKNAYLEAARAYSSKYMKKITNCSCICDTFAPGITGISLEQLCQFFKILPGEKIGVSYWKNSMLLPEKTVAGLYFFMQDRERAYEKSCENCIGKRIGCHYCDNARKRNEYKNIKKKN